MANNNEEWNAFLQPLQHEYAKVEAEFAVAVEAKDAAKKKAAIGMANTFLTKLKAGRAKLHSTTEQAYAFDTYIDQVVALIDNCG